jgi:hypothetical protein
MVVGVHADVIKLKVYLVRKCIAFLYIIITINHVILMRFINL